MKVFKAILGVLFGFTTVVMVLTMYSSPENEWDNYIISILFFGILTYFMFRKSKKVPQKSQSQSHSQSSQPQPQYKSVKPNYSPKIQPSLDYEKINICAKKYRKMYNEFTVIDFETTGLSPYDDEIIEVGAVKVSNREVTDSFGSLVDPCCPIPQSATKVNGITDDMVSGAPTIDQILPQLMSFIGDSVLVAHNAPFDMKFLINNAMNCGCTVSNPAVCTLSLSRKLFPYLKDHKLGTVAASLNIKINKYHRSVDDATATAHILIHCLNTLDRQDAENTAARNAEKIKAIDITIE